MAIVIVLQRLIRANASAAVIYILGAFIAL